MNLTEKELKLFTTKYRNKIGSTKGRTDKEGNTIEFLLTFEEYVRLYKDKNVLPSRNYVLSRVNDLGNYEIGNVFVQHNLDNLCDSLGKTSDLDKKINEYCIKHGYLRRIVKGMIKRKELIL